MNSFLIKTWSQIEVIDCEDEESTTYVETIGNRKHPVKPTTIDGVMEVKTDHCNVKTFSPRPTQALKVFKKSLKFLAVFGILVGMDLDYKWKWNLRFYLNHFLIGFFWLLLFYTQLKHVYNNERGRTLEQFAIYGTACSVKWNWN